MGVFRQANGIRPFILITTLSTYVWKKTQLPSLVRDLPMSLSSFFSTCVSDVEHTTSKLLNLYFLYSMRLCVYPIYELLLK